MKKLLFEEIERLRTYQDYGIELTSRTLGFCADIEEFSADLLLTNLDFLEKVSADPIDIIISTYGGEVPDMFAIVDAFKTSDCWIQCITKTKCMSAGPLIVAAADERLAYKNVQWMLHVGSGWSTDGNMWNQNAWMGWTNAMHETWLDLMDEYTKMPRSFWDKMCQSPKDRFFSSEDALEWGIIDEIIE